MSHRFVNMMVDRSIGRGRGRPGYSLHRIDPWRCFYPTRGAGAGAQALEELAANNNKKTWRTTMEDVRLPRSALSFFHPCSPDDIGDITLASLGCSSNDIISTDHDGNTLLNDIMLTLVVRQLTEC
ncbi:hypothetical protein PR202_gb10091 [Eleusine coracana subsp. coracana]|uniref:Uncharacterized protein n=1 Tax=Eleusine coracana subsp. coracana TaxID=191504 RepID=A0AAV5EJI0_ELECO|nr:hypothetical protein PR202_gb10091 [Eleusine coracana subsp. coracana]